MPAQIDTGLIPAVIRNAVDPEILKRAQSVEWCIDRDTGDDERGYIDAWGFSMLEPVTRQKTQLPTLRQNNGKKAVEWLDRVASCDSGLETPSSPFQRQSNNWTLQNQFAADDEKLSAPQVLEAVASTQSLGYMKRHSYSTERDGRPFPIFQVNKEQLANDVVFEVQRGTGERAVHYESAQHNCNEAVDLTGAMDFLDQVAFFRPNSRNTIDEREEEVIETCELNGGSRELEVLYATMCTNDQSRANELETWSDSLHQSIVSVEDIKLEGSQAECSTAAVERFVAGRIKCTILLPVREIKVEPKPIVVEMKKPLIQPEAKEEKLLEDPDPMWMRMGDAQYGPPFGTMTKYKPGEEEWIGPPCELCHKQIEERRCMLAENRKFHCWHFSCSFCLKILRPSDFLIAEADNKPYCLNCHRREFPEISLANLNFAAEAGEDVKNLRP